MNLRIIPYVICYSIVVCVVFYIFLLRIENNKLKESLNNAETLYTHILTQKKQQDILIENQNNKIEELKLEYDNYIKEHDKNIQNINDKYNKIQIDRSSCQSELNSIKSLLKQFNDGK